MKQHKKRCMITALSVIFVFVSGWWINNFTLQINVSEIKSDLINNEITIVHLTDLHGATFGDNNKTLISRVAALSPDFIVVTGDMFTYSDKEGEAVAVELLDELSDKFLVYYVNGEHDDKESFFDILKQKGVNVLNYEQQLVNIKNTRLHLYGIDNVYFPADFDFKNAFVKDDKTFSILLSHIPAYEKFSSFGEGLIVSGDTHGGIFRLPFIGAVYDGGIFFPDLNGKMTKGLYEKNGQYINISSGLGNYPFSVRFFNRPEISVIKLYPDK